MNINELKRELSKLSGVDFFNPKYRTVFKRFTADDDEETEDSADNQTNEGATENVEADSVANDQSAERIESDNEGDSESDISETDTAETEDEQPEIPTETQTADEQAGSNVTDELLTTKLELELVRAGIREDRLETAKRLFMPEFKASGGNVDEIRELIAQYPEWIAKGGGTQGFGMPLGDKADALTNEEKALKRMGINPRD